MASEPCSPEPVESQVVALCSEEANINEESQLPGSCSLAHKLFQRTLSPADVLHVHSYAKGDYGDGEAQPKEERRSEDSDIEKEKDNKHVGKPVSVTLLACSWIMFSLFGFNACAMILLKRKCNQYCESLK